MNVQHEFAEPRSPVPARHPALLWAKVPFLLVGLTAAAYGIIQHKMLSYELGMLSLGGLVAGWLSDHWIRREYPVPTTARQSVLAGTAYVIVVPIFLIVALALALAFPAWFPDSPLIPR